MPMRKEKNLFRVRNRKEFSEKFDKVYPHGSFPGDVPRKRCPGPLIGEFRVTSVANPY
jgi:hypothetical protein